MAFDGIVVANLAQELHIQLVNGRIAKITQPEPDELQLTIKTTDGQKRLCLSANATLPLVYLTDENKPGPMTAPNFCMLLRKYISNGRIRDITQPGLERILCLTIEHLDEMGDLSQKKLIIEIMGKHSNIIFCDSDDTIIDSIKHVPASMSSVREVLPGRAYFIPDTLKKTDPMTADFSLFREKVCGKPSAISKAIYTSFTGISPVTAEEICYLSGIDSSIPPKELSADMIYHLYTQFQLYLSPIREGHFQPAIYEKNGEPVEFSSLPLSHFMDCDCQSFDSISQVLETFYQAKSAYSRIRQKSADLRHIVQTALDRSRKKYDLQAKQLKETEGRDQFRKYGELLHTYGYGLKEGEDSLTVLDYETNEWIAIPLDPTLSASENAKRYFDRYDKQKRTFEALSGLIEETKNETIYLESVQTALDLATTEEDLADISEELSGGGYTKRKAAKKKNIPKNKPLHYISQDGYDIFVGKNNLQNDQLTFHFAQGNDWWFHVKQAPGSHVIVKSKGEELPDRVFEDAGRLAAYYSAMRGSGKVEIDYVEKKHVKKPNGAMPGFVVYYTNYSLTIDSDISKLKEAP